MNARVWVEVCTVQSRYARVAPSAIPAPICYLFYIRAFASRVLFRESFYLWRDLFGGFGVGLLGAFWWRKWDKGFSGSGGWAKNRYFSL